MQRLLILCFLLLVLACENQVDINASGEPVPVAYCILGLNDSIQKISLSQSFLPVNEYLNENNNQGNYIALQSYKAYIERIDKQADKEIYFFNKSIPGDEEGSINSGRTVIFESKFKVSSGGVYKLHIIDNNDLEIFSGQTSAIGPLVVLDPLEVSGRELTLTQEQGYLLRWEPSEFARVYQAVIYLNYLEKESDLVKSQKLRIPLSININSEQNHVISQFFNGRHFLIAIRDGIPYAAGIRRKALSLDFELFAGGEELSVYIGQEINGLSDFGQLNEYSNYDNAKGILSSRTSLWVKNIDISYITHDSLAYGLYTRQLGFIPSNEEL